MRHLLGAYIRASTSSWMITIDETCLRVRFRDSQHKMDMFPDNEGVAVCEDLTSCIKITEVPLTLLFPVLESLNHCAHR